MNTNTRAYFVFLGNSNWQQNQDFARLIKHAKHQVEIPGIQNAFLLYSDQDMVEWQDSLTQTGQTGSATGAITFPIILPVDLNQLQKVEGKNVPPFLTQFSRFQTTQAA
jgi:hypothetical protein